MNRLDTEVRDALALAIGQLEGPDSTPTQRNHGKYLRDVLDKLRRTGKCWSCGGLRHEHERSARCEGFK